MVTGLFLATEHSEAMAVCLCQSPERCQDRVPAHHPASPPPAPPPAAAPSSRSWCCGAAEQRVAVSMAGDPSAKVREAGSAGGGGAWAGGRRPGQAFPTSIPPSKLGQAFLTVKSRVLL